MSDPQGIAVNRIAGEGIAGTWLRKAPVVTVTSPFGTIDTPQATITWSTVQGAHPDLYHQVRVRTQSGTDLFVSDQLSGNPGTKLIDYQLSGGSTYELGVSVSDGSDWSEWGTTLVFVDAASVFDYPDNEFVGSIYEIGINGEGYMLDDRPDGDRRYARQSLSLDPPRLSTGDTPFSEAIERYSFASQSDWSGGADQKFRDRPASGPTLFWQGNSLDVFNEDGLQLLPRLATIASSTTASGAMVVASDRLVWHDATTTFRSINSIGGAQSNVTFTGFGTLVDWTSDGKYAYFTDGTRITRWDGITAGPIAAWSTPAGATITGIEWCTDRLGVVYTLAGRTVFSTFADDGTEEVAGGRFSFPAGTEIPAVTSGDGHVWLVVQKFTVCEIKAWKLGSKAAPFTALVLPAGQSVTALGFYLGNVLLRAIESLEGGFKRMVIYRAIPQDGTLSAERVLDTEKSASVDHSVGTFGGSDRFALFSWRAMTGTTRGIGAIDLSTGGWSKWSQSLDATSTNVTSICYWRGRILIASPAELIEVESDTLRAASGEIIGSIIDLGSNLRKVWDAITVTFDPLPADCSVTVEYSVDGGGSFLALGSENSGGAKVLELPLSVEADSLVVKVMLANSAGGTTTPIVKRVTAKCHALTLTDQLVVVPVNCSDKVSGANNHVLPDEAQRTSGAKRAQHLESLVGSRIKFQDVDWLDTQMSSVMEVVSAQSERKSSVYDQHAGRITNFFVCTLTLRRPLK